MAAAVSAQYKLLCEVTETLALALDNVTDPSFLHSIGSDEGTLNVSSTPAATRVFSDNKSLASGLGSLDLKSLAGPSGTTVDFDGLKVQLIALECPDTNGDGIAVFAKDATTGANLFGANNTAVTTQSLNPVARTTSANGVSADLNNVRIADVLLAVGTVTDGTHTPELQESTNDSDWTDVAAGDQIGTFAALSSDTVQSVRYIGTERYLRVVFTVTGGPATGAIAGAIIMARPEVLTVRPGMKVLIFTDDELEDVDSTHKDLQLAGTGTETINVILVAG